MYKRQIIDDQDYENLKDKIFTEKEFVFDIDEKNKIKGKIDLINLRDDGFAELIDFKSSQKKYSEKDLEEELQLKIYYLAIKKSNSIAELLPDIRNRTILPRYYVIGLEKYNFFTVTVHEKMEEMVTEKILSIISNIKKEKFDINPRNYFSCSSCESVSYTHLLNRISGIPLNEIAIIMKGTDFENSLIENYFYQNSIPFFRRSSRSVANNRYSAYLLNLSLIHISISLSGTNILPYLFCLLLLFYACSCLFLNFTEKKAGSL